MNNQTKPPGAMVLVPFEPTRDMLCSGWTSVLGKLDHESIAQLWQAMINIAPAEQPTAVGGEPEVQAFIHSEDGYMNERWVALRRDNSCNPRALILQDHHRAYVAALQAENRRLRQFETALAEWADKTDWVRKSIQPKELGMHLADVMKGRIDASEARNAEAMALLRDVAKQPWLYDVIGSVREFITQSAPTGKTCGACPGCTDGCRVDRESPLASIGGLVQGVQDQRSEVKP